MSRYELADVRWTGLEVGKVVFPSVEALKRVGVAVLGTPLVTVDTSYAPGGMPLWSTRMTPPIYEYRIDSIKLDGEDYIIEDWIKWMLGLPGMSFDMIYY